MKRKSKSKRRSKPEAVTPEAQTGLVPFSDSIDQIMALGDQFFGRVVGGGSMRPATAQLADQVRTILAAEHPITLRGLHYRLVSNGTIPNTPKAYKRLARATGRMRELGIIPRTWIVDHVRATLKPSSWSGLADFADTVRDAYRKDVWADQSHCVEFLIEKDATAGSIQPVTEQYDVALRVCRGYASISFAGEIADEWSRIEKPIHAYYLGDFDPSGFDIERDLREKIARYASVGFAWHRLGVVAEDFDKFSLERLAVKATDSRSRRFQSLHGHACAELDALPATELRRRVETAILSHVDPAAWDRLQKVEAVERASIEEYAEQIAQAG